MADDEDFLPERPRRNRNTRDFYAPEPPRTTRVTGKRKKKQRKKKVSRQRVQKRSERQVRSLSWQQTTRLRTEIISISKEVRIQGCFCAFYMFVCVCVAGGGAKTREKSRCEP